MPSGEKKGARKKKPPPSTTPAAPPPPPPARVPPAVPPPAASPSASSPPPPAAAPAVPPLHPALVPPAPQPPYPPPGFQPTLHPWGGYVNMLQQPQFSALGENFHFVGHTHNFAPISPSPLPSAQGQPSAHQGTGNTSINIDGDDDVVETTQTTKRRHWSHEEEVRLASAWLNNSNDSVRGNDKRGDTFWKDITADFNSNTQADRQRDTNSLKIHWSRLKTVINDFNGCWTKATRVNKSGASDDQLMDEALKMFETRYKKPFTLIHWWRTLKNQPKWCAYVAQLEKEKQQSQVPIHVDDDIGNSERPIGREAAKAQRNGKRKSEEITEGLATLGDNINKIIAVTQERKQEREKATGAHLEISRLKLKIAEKEMRSNQLLVYNSLLQQDISQMTEEAKARRDKNIAMLDKVLFSNNDEV